MRSSHAKVLLSLVFTFVVLVGLVVAAPPAFAATIVVDSTGDVAANDGVCTLREAIAAANDDTASGGMAGECAAGSGTDTIRFGIGAGGPHTITPATPLPSIVEPVTIDGYTETGASANSAAAGTDAVIMIEIDGTDDTFDGLTIATAGAGSTVRGLAITNFINGIVFSTSGGNAVEGSFIGTDPDGTTVEGNNNGILVANSASNTIGGSDDADRNILSGNQTGIRIDTAGSTSNTIAGNLIGTDRTGGLDRGNAQVGINLQLGPEDNVIGGTAAGARNVISGNNAGGITIGSNAIGNLIQGNFIGTDAAGTGAVPNGQEGVEVVGGADDTQIGGTAAGAGNLISGNSLDGIFLSGNAIATSIQGNTIGLDATGATALANGTGIEIVTATETTIGGTTAAARNVISGNTGTGILFTGSSATMSTVRGNYIGTDATGELPRPNGSSGIRLNSADENQIGGTVGTTDGGPCTGACNVISGNTGSGIATASTNADDNVIEGNFIGTDKDGDTPLPNSQHGVSILNASGNRVGGSAAGAGNVISGNTLHGVFIVTGATGNVVEGNLIGTNATGTAAAANSGNGVFIDNSPDNTIGGTDPGAGNVISGNAMDGVQILDSGATGNDLQGNFIGTDAAGNADIGNGVRGVDINGASDNTIGGTDPGAGNVISGNDEDGLRIEGSAVTGSLVQGNLVGTNAAGDADVGNATDGVSILEAESNTIGGTDPGAGNVISGNGFNGVFVRGDGNEVRGNVIGTNAAGDDLGNDEDGVIVFEASNNAVGGTGSGMGNTVAFNGETGVLVRSNSALENAILGNSIFDNDSVGIDLRADGDPVNTVTENDPGDADTGPNDLQNFPVLTAAAAGSTVIQGTLNSVANTAFRIEFFSSSACDASGHGEGETFLGSTNVTTNAGGDASISETLGATAPVGSEVTATATRLDSGDPTATSELSECVTVSELPPPPPPAPPPTCPGLEDVVGNHIVGTTGDDALTGTTERDVICGLAGNDTIEGLGGNDLIDGGPGEDRMVGGAGRDVLLGRGGNDLLKGSGGRDLAKGGGGKDSIRGGGGKDTLRGQAKDDNLRGQGGNDKLFGNAGDDALNGGPGTADRCRQGPGSGPVKNCER